MWHTWFKFILTFTLINLTSAKPNVLIFLVDDLGIGDVGCFGNDTIKTPNIDRLAKEGARLRHDVTPDSICTPNRAAFLTGRYPIRSGLASEKGQLRALVFTSASGGLPQNETTFAEIASAAGYRTGIIGKWHLGLHLSSNSDFHFHPLKQGFHYFYGLPHSNDKFCEPGHYVIEIFYPGLNPTNILIAAVIIGVTLYIFFLTGLLSRSAFVFLLTIIVLISLAISACLLMMAQFNCFVMKNYDVVEQPTILENLTMRFTDEAVNFIRTNKDSPFLLYMSFAKVHAPLFNTRPFVNHSVHGRYGDNVEEMDWSVGQIVAAVKELGLKENTFVYFTSDNGPHLEYTINGGWSGIYKGGKGQCWDGGVRMPTIVSWPGHIPAGISLDELTSNLDLLPTIGKLTGADLPQDRVIDGNDLLPLLTNKTQQSSHEFLFHYCGNQVHAVRYHPKNSDTVWKAHFMTPKWTEGTESCIGKGIVCRCHGDRVKFQDPPLLYDVIKDHSESSPMPVHMPEYKEVMKDIYPALKTHKESIESAPGQLSGRKNFFHPSLQMCCNFPFCSCKETGKKL
ncbi:hypothetical protein ACROYT_G005131 [Oculina patagonica]